MPAGARGRTCTAAGRAARGAPARGGGAGRARAGGCAGTPLPLGLPDGTVDTESGVSPGASEGARRELLDLYNLATALDPALIFLSRSCPFYEGRATGHAPRTARYRGSDAFGWEGVDRDLPEVGALRPYAKSPAHLVEQQFDRYRAWLAALERAGRW